MPRKFRATLLAIALGVSAFPARAQGFDHSPWDRVLKRFVTEAGRVDYAALKADSRELDAYVAALGVRSLVSHPNDFPSRESQLAYWINSYNALVFHAVIEHWPVKTVRDIGTLPYSFFWRKKFTVGGKQYTLRHIENEFLRRGLAEPRIHFALVCAALSCPRLQRDAYTPENTERLLEEAARFYFREPRNLKIDTASHRVTVPRIMTWYREDFEKYVRERRLARTGNALLAYVRLYASEADRAAIDALRNPRVDDFEYDWTINAVDVPAAGMKPREGGKP